MEKNVCGFDIAFLKQVKSLLEDSNIQELELEEGDSLYLRISKKKARVMPSGCAPAVLYEPAEPSQHDDIMPKAPAPAKEQKPSQKAAYEDENKYFKIKSPVIGTFYEAPSPQSPPYVKTGDTVSKDTTVCIVEAMKIMNEIKADIQGKVVEILKTNSSPVQSGEALFIVEKI